MSSDMAEQDECGADGPSAGPVPSVLLVEDEGIVSIYLETLLADFGISVCGTATTGAEAIALAERHRPNLALVDINLRGGMDGIDVALFLKKKLSIPTIFLSGMIDSATRARAEAVHALDFLSKPYMPDELEAALSKALRRG